MCYLAHLSAVGNSTLLNYLLTLKVSTKTEEISRLASEVIYELLSSTGKLVSPKNPTQEKNATKLTIPGYFLGEHEIQIWISNIDSQSLIAPFLAALEKSRLVSQKSSEPTKVKKVESQLGRGNLTPLLVLIFQEMRPLSVSSEASVFFAAYLTTLTSVDKKSNQNANTGENTTEISQFLLSVVTELLSFQVVEWSSILSSLHSFPSHPTIHSSIAFIEALYEVSEGKAKDGEVENGKTIEEGISSLSFSRLLTSAVLSALKNSEISLLIQKRLSELVQTDVATAREKYNASHGESARFSPSVSNKINAILFYSEIFSRRFAMQKKADSGSTASLQIINFLFFLLSQVLFSGKQKKKLHPSLPSFHDPT